MDKKLSIIVPVYNVEKYLDQCIHSIVNQTYRDFTLILVDDGSTDSSGIKCDQWKKKDHRIIVYHKPNGGLISAWKYGLMRTDTEYIGFVDSDDWIDSNMYSTLLLEAEKNNSDIVACGWVSDREDGKENKRENVKLAGNTFDADTIRREIYPILISGGDYHWMGISPNRWTKIFKRELLLKNIEYCDERVSIGEDLLTNFCTIPNAERITLIKDFFPYHYRIHSESMIHKYSDLNYKKINILRECLMKVNGILEYDFTIQINTYYIKLMLAQLDNEMLFSKKNYVQLKNSMKKLYQSKKLQDALSKSEISKLPIKYRIYIKCIQMHLYTLLMFIRKVKKI
ncbi:MAG: glycosyltransferase [Lachnospiraceae bacterium]|nr:glycosyltransferase [Lachnospiraceae bacterium]